MSDVPKEIVHLHRDEIDEIKSHLKDQTFADQLDDNEPLSQIREKLKKDYTADDILFAMVELSMPEFSPEEAIDMFVRVRAAMNKEVSKGLGKAN